MIDTNPEALARMRDDAVHGDLWDDRVILALIDALEEARTERDNALTILDVAKENDAGANARIAALRAQLEEAKAALRDIAHNYGKQGFEGRKNYARGDEGLADYWSDRAKEYSATAREALAALEGKATP
jgi:hypothetical protein